MGVCGGGGGMRERDCISVTAFDGVRVLLKYVTQCVRVQVTDCRVSHIV